MFSLYRFAEEVSSVFIVENTYGTKEVLISSLTLKKYFIIENEYIT